MDGLGDSESERFYGTKDPVWEGTTLRSSLKPWVLELRDELADAARAYRWGEVLALIERYRGLENSWRVGGRSFFTPLHQAAHGGAPEEVIERLIELGAWRTLRTAEEERAVDIARRRGNSGIVPLLEPAYARNVPENILGTIEKKFHRHVRNNTRNLVDAHRLRLPQLEILLELDVPLIWFPVPGMTGGFQFWLEGEGRTAHLVSQHWARVVENSEEQWEIRPEGMVQVPWRTLNR
jgi:hypothetical protein